MDKGQRTREGSEHHGMRIMVLSCGPVPKRVTCMVLLYTVAKGSHPYTSENDDPRRVI